MAEDKLENEVSNSPLRDMNGNVVREGDLVMVLLDKPAVAGFVVSIKEPSLLTARKEQQKGLVVVHGIVNMRFDVGRINVLANVAKLVHPQSQAIVEAVAQEVKKPHVVLPIQKESADLAPDNGVKPTDSSTAAPDVTS